MGGETIPSSDAASRNEAEAVRMHPRSLLPDCQPQVPTAPTQGAVLCADHY